MFSANKIYTYTAILPEKLLSRRVVLTI